MTIAAGTQLAQQRLASRLELARRRSVCSWMLSANSSVVDAAAAAPPPPPPPASATEATDRVAVTGTPPQFDAVVAHATDYAENLLTLMLTGERLPVVEVLASIWLLGQTILAFGGDNNNNNGSDASLRGQSPL